MNFPVLHALQVILGPYSASIGVAPALLTYPLVFDTSIYFTPSCSNAELTLCVDDVANSMKCHVKIDATALVQLL